MAMEIGMGERRKDLGSAMSFLPLEAAASGGDATATSNSGGRVAYVVAAFDEQEHC